ncbi:MAG: potassium transporter Kup [Actinomycetota bacterium]|nr:potassium transporter Kup [Actinomycetota bacterium]
MSERHGTRGAVPAAIGTLGIVYGDIGTSPIYAFRESFTHGDLALNQTSAYGAASVVFWALVLVIAVKYLALVMRADNHGEGGILAITALVAPGGHSTTRVTGVMVALGVFGTSLLYGDGLITPAISVLSAVEGFGVATTAVEDWIIPIAVAILVLLFLAQPRGTAGISKVFSPVMVLWFVTISVLGTRQILREPGVLWAVWPGYAVEFFADQPMAAFIALGSIFLVVTGGEALYADMGHFGRNAIQLSWYTFVMPALLLCYFGQAALLSREPLAAEDPFFQLAPEWAVVPLAVLATGATVIASQALISGAFSLTAQAIQLDYLPRLDVRHTSDQQSGQIYVPLVNWLLMIGCIALVVGFGSSSNLAAAYGIAVTTTMVITTLLFHTFVIDRWGWGQLRAAIVVAPLLFVDTAFFAANVPKIPNGGWLPLVVGFGLVLQMTTWRRGRQLVATRVRRGQRPVLDVVDEALADSVRRVPGVAVYMFKGPDGAPPAMITNLAHNHVLHDTTLVLSVETSDVPRVTTEKRLDVSLIAGGVYRVVVNYGFMEDPDVVAALRVFDVDGCTIDPMKATYFIGRETVTSTPEEGMPVWREQLFELLNRGAASASRFFNLPRDRVFEVGTHVEI